MKHWPRIRCGAALFPVNPLRFHGVVVRQRIKEFPRPQLLKFASSFNVFIPSRTKGKVARLTKWVAAAATARPQDGQGKGIAVPVKRRLSRLGLYIEVIYRRIENQPTRIASQSISEEMSSGVFCNLSDRAIFPQWVLLNPHQRWSPEAGGGFSRYSRI